MKKILLILFLAIGYLSFSQGQPTALPTLYNGKIYQYTQYLAVDSGLFSPRRDTNFIPKQGGCVVFKTSDSTLYVSTGRLTGRKWKGIGSGGGTGVYNAGYGMLLIAGNFSVDTTIISTVAYSQGLYNILNSVKLNITDTSSMLIPYLRKADTTAMLSKYLRKADTVTLSNRINLKRNISDTALNSQSTTTRGRTQYLIDSLNTVVSGAYLPLIGGIITGNLTVNSFITSLSSISATNVLEGKDDIWHWKDIKVLNKDASNMETWVQRKTYYSDGVNLTKIGTAAIDTITVAKSAVYATNVAGSYTNRSLIDKGHLDSNLALKRPLYYETKIIGDSNVVLLPTNDVVFFVSGTVDRDITLPNPTIYNGKQIILANSDGANKRTFTVTGGASVIDITGSTITFIPYHHSYTLISNGIDWRVVNYY